MAGKIQISHLSHKISLDADGFAKTAIASRSEVNQFRKALRTLRDPMERYEKDLKDAEALLRFGADGQELYNRAVKQAEKRLRDATGETERLRMAEEKLNRDRKKSDAIMDRHISKQNKLHRELRETERLYASGTLDVRSYRLEMDRLNREMSEGSFLQQAGSRLGSMFGLDQVLGASGASAAGQVAILGGAVTLAQTYFRTMQRGAEFAVNRFNTDREAIDNLAKSARALNLDIETLTGFQFAFGQGAGVSDEGTIKIFQELSKRSSEAAQGLGESRLAFAELNLEAAELAALSPDKQLLMIADAMQDVELRSDRLRIAGRLFGEEQAKAFIALEGGSKAVQNMLSRADRLGLSVSEEDAKSVESMNDAMDSLARTAEAMSRNLTILAAPAIEEMADELIDMSETLMENKDLLKVLFNVAFLENLKTGTLALKLAGSQLDQYLELLGAGVNMGAMLSPINKDDNPLGIKAFGEGAQSSIDPAASIVAGSREAFEAQFRFEVDSQLDVAKEQRDIAKEALEVQRGMAGALIAMSSTMEQSI